MPGTSITVILTSIMVDDQAKAHAFYTDILGFHTCKDVSVGECRWPTVTSPAGSYEIGLVLEPNANPAGGRFQSSIYEQSILRHLLHRRPRRRVRRARLIQELARSRTRLPHALGHARPTPGLPPQGRPHPQLRADPLPGAHDRPRLRNDGEFDQRSELTTDQCTLLNDLDVAEPPHFGRITPTPSPTHA